MAFKMNGFSGFGNESPEEKNIIKEEKQKIVDVVSEDVENTESTEEEGPPVKYAQYIAMGKKLLGSMGSKKEDDDKE